MSQARTHVAVIGDAFLDILAGPVERMPRFGGDVDAPSIAQLAGGSALNVAVGIGELVRGTGNTCSFHGLVGSDEFGKVLKRKIVECNVADHLVVDEGVGTGCCIVLSGPEDRGFVTSKGATGNLSVAHLESINQLLRPAPEEGSPPERLHVHISGFYSCPKLAPDLAKYLRDLRSQLATTDTNLTVSFDSNCDSTEVWEGGVVDILKEVDIFLPNESEAQGISREQDLEAAVNKLATMVREAVVMTCGGDGSLLQTREGAEAGNRPRRGKVAPNIKPVDFTGAGDAFDSGFIYRWAVCRGSLDDGVVAGACCGGLCTQSVGANTAPVSASTLEAMEKTARPLILD